MQTETPPSRSAAVATLILGLVAIGALLALLIRWTAWSCASGC
jgi:hypothetical protein